jgi:hypothetical protein
MQKLRNSTVGTKLVVAAGTLLFLGLFFTWQTVHVDYGPAGIAKVPQDGWDAWGLLIGLLAATTVTLVVLRRLTEVEMPETVPWETIAFALGAAVFAITVLKSLTDAHSTWTSYVFVAAAGALVAGCYLLWTETRGDEGPELRRGEVSPTA